MNNRNGNTEEASPSSSAGMRGSDVIDERIRQLKRLIAEKNDEVGL